MPELPEVETVVCDLLALGVVGCRIDGVRVTWDRSVSGLPVWRFQAQLNGVRILDVWRRAKFIVIPVSSRRWLLGHLRMSGRIAVTADDVPRHPHERMAFSLNDGREIRFIDLRKFGRWYLVDDPDIVLGMLGPEPLAPDFEPDDLAAILQRYNRMLKPLLLDQHVLAGLGNIYVDEALWAARLHPCTRSRSVSMQQAHVLYTAIRKVLKRGVRARGTSLGRGESNFYSVTGHRGRNQDDVKVFRRHGEPCPRCGAILQRIIVGQRSTHICPACQCIERGGMIPRLPQVSPRQRWQHDATTAT